MTDLIEFEPLQLLDTISSFLTHWRASARDYSRLIHVQLVMLN